MHKLFISVILLMFLFNSGLYSQGRLYMPKNISMAYERGTRSLNGAPGPHYWQNKGTYDIHYFVYPPNPEIRGEESIVYHNNSKDTLGRIVMRFVNNIHKVGAVRMFPVEANDLSSGLHITNFVLNGKRLQIKADHWSTIGTVPLTEPLKPGDSLKLSISWTYTLTRSHGREGIIDSTTYYMAYAYPRISVYDDYNGWDELEHNGRTEFYNDFNDYLLKVTVPDNFAVWATGDWLNSSEILQPEVFKRYVSSLSDDAIINIASRTEMQSHQIIRPGKQGSQTWIFKYNHVSDVCVGLSDHYVWDASSVPAYPDAQRRISVQAAYNDTSTDYPNFVRWERQAMLSFANAWPGVAFPYPKLTAFQGYADMEYPMMINDASLGHDTSAAHWIGNHEMAHTFFPFYMGINETRYAFMDEGWATALEYLVGIYEYGKEKADHDIKTARINAMVRDYSTESQIPAITMSSQLSGMAYRYNSYDKASLSYIGLKDLLGDTLFRKSLHVYMDRWHGKHPMPWDYFYTINDATGRRLNWYWNNWYFSCNYIDLKAKAIKKTAKGYLLELENVGGFAIPFDIVMTNSDGKEKRIHQTPAVWETHPKTVLLTLPAIKNMKSVSVDGGIFMDATPSDNTLYL